MALDPKILPNNGTPNFSGTIPADFMHPQPSTALTLDQNGRVEPQALEHYLVQRLETSKMNGFVPKDGARYGIHSGTPQEWAHYFVALGKQESDFKAHHVGDIGKFKGNSNGLFQLSPGDALTYHMNGNKPFTLAQLQNPATNIDIAIHIHDTLLASTGGIRDGVGHYFGSIKHGWTPDGAEHLEAVAENRQQHHPHPHRGTHVRRAHHPSPMRNEYGVAELTSRRHNDRSGNTHPVRHVVPGL